MGTMAGYNTDISVLGKVEKQLELTKAEIAAIIGVNQSTVWRWQEKKATPRGIALSRLSQIEDLRNLLRQVFDGPDLARKWLRTARPQSLGGEITPFDVMYAGRIDRVLTVLQFLARGA